MSNLNLEKSTTVPQKREDILDLVGGDGPWQRGIFIVIFCCAIPLASHNMAMSFLAPNLDHWCARPPEHANLTVEEWKEVGLPPDDRSCSRYKVVNLSYIQERSNYSNQREIIACESWEYDGSYYGSNILSKWDLVCDREWLVSMSKSIFIPGYLCSVLVFGHLSDRLGRRTVIAVSNFIAFAAATVCAFSVSYLMFAVCRFFIAVGVAGSFSTSFVMLMEVIGPEYRSAYGVVENFGWSVGYISLPGIAWLIKDWFWIQIIITVPCVFLLSSWWFLPESPRWLLSQDKQEEALKTLLKAGKRNGKNLSDINDKLKEVISKTSKAHETEEKINANIFQLWSMGLWKKTSIIFYSWFVISFVYYGLSYNTNELAGDPFLNFALYGLVEIPSYILCFFVIRPMGRRNPMAASLVAGGMACLAMYPLPEDPWWISVSVALFGKFCITVAYAIVYIYTTELFPTVIRNVGLGSSSMCGRFGSIIAPFVRELGHATHPMVPQVIFGVLSATAGFLVLLLPETNNSTVPDTLKEAAEIS